MDCPAFFRAAADRLGERARDPSRTTTGGQCVYEFYHPRVLDRFGDGGLAASFNRSGVVWAPAGRRLGVQVRVPDRFDDDVTAALADAALPFERSDHRGASAPDGEMVQISHFAARDGDVSNEGVERTLAAVGDALAV